LRAGITAGVGYAGIIGGQQRCEYGGVGDVVNLAARLMMKTKWGQIFVAETIAKNAPQFRFAYQGDFTYKGVAAPVPTYTLSGRKIDSRQQRFPEAMIGRQVELQRLQEVAKPIFRGVFAGIVYIYGEAGIGKSRLAYALRETITTHTPITWCHCPVDQILRRPFNPFKTYLRRYFEQAPERSEGENRAKFEEKYAALVEALSSAPMDGTGGGGPDPAPHIKELIRTKSVFGAQIGLFWPDSLWEHLDAKGKYENTLSAIKTFFLAQSLLNPAVIELEDGHWIDRDSETFLKALTRNIPEYPILLLVTLRYNDDGIKPTFDLEGGSGAPDRSDLSFTH
jgi:hypothetical protein